MEQSNVLKEEIRRMERNQERVKHLDNQICSEYFKNIGKQTIKILKYSIFSAKIPGTTQSQ